MELHRSQVIPFPTSGTPLTSAWGTYVVGNLIGDGQYGSVYEARGPFDELYALKMYRPANRHYETVKSEWSAEMKRLESFRHPYIVYIYDAFEENYLFYIALERCDTSLRALMGKPFPAALLFEFARQLLMALSYLHDNGLVHSDLHGGNVLVTQLQTRPIIKLTDFGVAHQLTGEHWFRPHVANPKILTPELVTAGYTTRQSDLYQLGLLMFRMHTGYSAIPDGVQYHDFTRLIAEGVPRQRAEQLATPIGNVIAKLLRRRDTYRYQSAREVWEDLRQLRPMMTTGQQRAIPMLTVQNGAFSVPNGSSPAHAAPHAPSHPGSHQGQAPPAPGSHPGAVERRGPSQTITPPMGAAGETTPPIGAIPTPPMGVPAFAQSLADPHGHGPPSRTELTPPSRTDLTPPSRTDVTPPSRTELTPPSSPGSFPGFGGEPPPPPPSSHSTATGTLRPGPPDGHPGSGTLPDDDDPVRRT